MLLSMLHVVTCAGLDFRCFLVSVSFGLPTKAPSSEKYTISNTQSCRGELRVLLGGLRGDKFPGFPEVCEPE